MGLQRIFLSLLLLIVGQDAGAETIEITRSYWFKEPLPWEAAFRHSTGGRGREKESIERFRFMETLRVEHEGKRLTFSQVYLRDHGDKGQVFVVTPRGLSNEFDCRKGVCRRGGGIKPPLGAVELDREIDYTDDNSRNRNLITVSRVNELFVPAFGKLTDVIRVERKLIRKDSGELREHIVYYYLREHGRVKAEDKTAPFEELVRIR